MELGGYFFFNEIFEFNVRNFMRNLSSFSFSIIFIFFFFFTQVVFVLLWTQLKKVFFDSKKTAFGADKIKWNVDLFLLIFFRFVIRGREIIKMNPPPRKPRRGQAWLGPQAVSALLSTFAFFFSTYIILYSLQIKLSTTDYERMKYFHGFWRHSVLFFFVF